MRGLVPDFDLVTPKDFAEALELLKDGGWTPFAGGTDLMVQFESGALKTKRFVNLLGLSELQGISLEKDFVVLGAATTYSEIRDSEILQKEFPLLGHAARETGALAIQNRGTLGGNIANASPAADTPPALLVYDAEIELISHSGSRRIPYERFHLDYKKTQRSADELILRVRLPRKLGEQRHYYRKVGTRSAQAISKVCLAARLKQTDGKIEEVRVAFGAVAPIPFRCVATEKVLLGKKLDSALIDRAKRELAREIQPLSDIRSTEAYRRQVAVNLLEEFLTQS